MMKLLQFLWCGCWHNWAQLERSKVFDQDRPTDARPIGYASICKCTKCGEMKRFNLY